MLADSKGAGASSSGTGVTVTVTLADRPTATSYVLVAVGISTATNTVTGITSGTGTFVKAASMLSTNRTLELWVGYNFGTSWPTSLVVTRDAGTANMAVTTRIVDIFADTTVAPSFTASAGNTATSTAPDTNTLTPAVGDLMIAGVVLASTTADSTARTHTGNTYWDNAGTELTNTRVELGWSKAMAAASSKEVWTVTSVEWAAIQAMWTPAAPPAASAALVVKGLSTAALDAASAY